MTKLILGSTEPWDIVDVVDHLVYELEPVPCRACHHNDAQLTCYATDGTYNQFCHECYYQYGINAWQPVTRNWVVI